MYPRRVMYNDLYTYPYRHHRANVYSSYDIAALPSISDVDICVSPYYRDYGYRRGVSYFDYPYYNYAPRTISTLPVVQKDICYYYDNPDIIYDDVYGNAVRVSRSKAQIVDIYPKHSVRLPRSTVVRHPSLPVYERAKPTRLVPIYHSANPGYIVSSRRSYIV